MVQGHEAVAAAMRRPLLLALVLLGMMVLAPWSVLSFNGPLASDAPERPVSTVTGSEPLAWSGWVSPAIGSDAAHELALAAATWHPGTDDPEASLGGWSTWSSVTDMDNSSPVWWSAAGGTVLLQFAEGADVELAWWSRSVDEFLPGVTVGHAMPGLSLSAWVDSEAAMEQLLEATSDWGIVSVLPWHSGLRSRAEWAVNASAPASWEVTLHAAIPPGPRADLLASLDAVGSVRPAGGGSFYVDLEPMAVAKLVLDARVLFLMPEPTWVEFSPRASEIVGINASRAGTGWDGIARGWLDGSGQVACVMDAGLDVDHPDLPDHNNSRLVSIHDYNGDGFSDNASGHGSHVAGTVLGDGTASNGIVQGMAPNASLIFQAIMGSGPGLGPPSDLTAGFDDCRDDGGHLQTNSWGGGSGPAYDSRARAVDAYSDNHTDLLILFAAGNSGPSYQTVHHPATNKNGISVGASENEWPEYAYPYKDHPNSPWNFAPWRNDSMANNREGMAAFSSRGSVSPSYMGKPDVVAPGTWVLAPRSAGETTAASVHPEWEGPGNLSNDYQFLSGTSMATPTTAGTILLLRQALEANVTAAPTNLLLKALTIHGATQIMGQFPGSSGDVDGWDSGSRTAGQWNTPDPNMGWGRVNLTRSLSPAPGLDRLSWDIELNTTASRWSQRLVHDTVGPLVVTLAWNDPPASVGTNNTTVHDLDLELIAPNGSVYWGNVFADNVSELDPDHAYDREWADVVERIIIPDAADGVWEVRVDGRLLTQGNESAVLLFDGDIDARADLSVNMTLTPEAPFLGDLCTLDWVVSNDGPTLAAAFDIHIWRGDASDLLEQRQASLNGWESMSGNRTVNCDRSTDRFGITVSGAVNQRLTSNDELTIDVVPRVLDLGVLLADPTPVAQNGSAPVGLFLWNNGTEPLPLAFALPGQTYGLNVTGIPSGSYDLALGAQQALIELVVHAAGDAPIGLRTMTIELTSAQRPGWVRNITWRVVVQATSELDWGGDGDSTFEVSPASTVGVSVNLTNHKEVADLATIRLVTSMPWTVTWSLPEDPLGGGDMALAGGELIWVDLQIAVPPVIDGQPGIDTDHVFRLAAESALDGVVVWHELNVRLEVFHNVTIDADDSVHIVDPGGQARVPLRLRNVGNAPQGLDVQLRALDADGILLDPAPTQRLELDGWMAAVFNDFSVGWLEANRSGLVHIGIQSPMVMSGSLLVEVVVRGLSGDQGEQSVRMTTTIVWERNASLAANVTTCGVVLPGRGCSVSLAAANGGNAADAMQLRVAGAPPWLAAAVDERFWPLERDESSDTGTLALGVDPAAGPGLSANVSVSLLLAGTTTVVDVVHVRIEVAAVPAWNISVLESGTDDRLTFVVTLRNTGNGPDGVFVSLRRDLSTPAGFEPPREGVTDGFEEVPTEFSLPDLAPGESISFSAWLDLPRDAPANGTAHLTVEARSVVNPSVVVEHTGEIVYLGSSFREDPSSEKSRVDRLRAAGIDAYNSYQAVIWAGLGVIAALPLLRVMRRRRVAQLSGTHENPFLGPPLDLPAAAPSVSHPAGLPAHSAGGEAVLRSSGGGMAVPTAVAPAHPAPPYPAPAPAAPAGTTADWQAAFQRTPAAPQPGALDPIPRLAAPDAHSLFAANALFSGEQAPAADAELDL